MDWLGSCAAARLSFTESSEAQDAFAERYFEVVRQRRAERDEAARALGEAEAAQRTEEARPSVETLQANWDKFTPTEKRELLAVFTDKWGLRVLQQNKPELLLEPLVAAQLG